VGRRGSKSALGGVFAISLGMLVWCLRGLKE
jgi:hypothetical protein